MNKIILTAMLCLCAANLAYAQGRTIIGLWQDKTNDPETYFWFKKNNDFRFRIFNIYTKKFYQKDGVWELGNWEVKDSRTGKKSGYCTLSIYSGNDNCCFTYKFIRNNLILINEVPGNQASGLCSQSRVLIPTKAEK